MAHGTVGEPNGEGRGATREKKVKNSGSFTLVSHADTWSRCVGMTSRSGSPWGSATKSPFRSWRRTWGGSTLGPSRWREGVGREERTSGGGTLDRS